MEVNEANHSAAIIHYQLRNIIFLHYLQSFNCKFTFINCLGGSGHDVCCLYRSNITFFLQHSSQISIRYNSQQVIILSITAVAPKRFDEISRITSLSAVSERNQRHLII
jgi:hypothetical protein